VLQVRYVTNLLYFFFFGEKIGRNDDMRFQPVGSMFVETFQAGQDGHCASFRPK
jgi:hypothetical protein